MNSPKDQVSHKGDAQEDGGYTTPQIRNQRHNLTVFLTHGGPGYVLEKYTNSITLRSSHTSKRKTSFTIL